MSGASAEMCRILQRLDSGDYVRARRPRSEGESDDDETSRPCRAREYGNGVGAAIVPEEHARRIEEHAERVAMEQAEERKRMQRSARRVVTTRRRRQVKTYVRGGVFCLMLHGRECIRRVAASEAMAKKRILRHLGRSTIPPGGRIIRVA